MSQQPVISLNQATKKLGRKSVLHQLSVDLFAGELTLLLGRNGAGKSTLLRVLSGLMKVDCGSYTIANTSTAIYQNYLGHQLMLYEHLSVREHLNIYRKVLEVEQNSASLASGWGLESVLDLMVGDLSRGQCVRLALLRTFMRVSPLLILDEPTSSLDDAGVDIFLDSIARHLASGASILIATHDLLRLRQAASRIMVIDRGEIAFDTRLTQSPSTRGFEQAISFYHESNR